MMDTENMTPAQETVVRPPMPLWAKIVYLVLVPLVLVAWVLLARGLVQQRDVTRAVEALALGPAPGRLPADAACARLMERPQLGLLFLVQELQQDPADDPRMVEASALRRSAEWTILSTRRTLLELLRSNMEYSGALRPGFTLPPERAAELDALIREREADTEAGYEDQKITEVLKWIRDGAPGEPKGYERIRVERLLAGYQKKQLKGGERTALTRLSEQWRASDQPVRRALADQFGLILAGKPAQLTDDERAECLRAAGELEKSYEASRVTLTAALLQISTKLAGEHARIHHPLLFELSTLLGSPYPEVRKGVAESLLLFRYHKHVVIFLGKQALRSHVNPVMAVETARLTKEEHERKLEAENLRRRIESISLMTRIQVDYCKRPYELIGVHARDIYDLPESRKIMNDNVVVTLRALTDDPKVHDEVTRALAAIEAACPREGTP